MKADSVSYIYELDIKNIFSFLDYLNDNNFILRLSDIVNKNCYFKYNFYICTPHETTENQNILQLRYSKNDIIINTSKLSDTQFNEILALVKLYERNYKIKILKNNV